MGVFMNKQMSGSSSRETRLANRLSQLIQVPCFEFAEPLGTWFLGLLPHHLERSVGLQYYIL